VAKVVEAQRCELGAPDGRPEDAGHEVVFASDHTAPGREHEPELVRDAGEELLADDALPVA
jgi:hypothetical protein